MSVQAIQRVFATYCRAIDDGRLDDVAKLYAADGALVLEAFGVRATGPVEIRAKLTEITDPRIKATHASFNHQIDVDGSKANATADFIVIDSTGAPKIIVVGRYFAKFVLVGSDWKIKEWNIEIRANAFTPAADPPR